MTPEKIEILTQDFVMEALQELNAEWAPLRELPYDYNIYETLVWCGVAERELEQLIGPGEIPCGTQFYYRLAQDRA